MDQALKVLGVRAVACSAFVQGLWFGCLSWLRGKAIWRSGDHVPGLACSTSI